MRKGSELLDLSFELPNTMIELAITSREAEDKGGHKSDDDTDEEDEEDEEQEQEQAQKEEDQGGEGGDEGDHQEVEQQPQR